MRDELAKAMDGEWVYFNLAREFTYRYDGNQVGDLMAKYRLSYDDVCYLQRKAHDILHPPKAVPVKKEEQMPAKKPAKYKNSFWHRWFPSRATAMKRELDYRKKLGYDR